ncbi:Vitamin B12 import ATP-binding protein BtuD [Candidatus Methanoperedenaceae archaeon GB37]|nr:Vitamin B12 import ATP-binding protein BtuD [Candidatus Methanoperedenaceae archaeon GB37]
MRYSVHAIEVYNLSYSYPDGTQALKDVNLTVEEGKKTAILGPNGSGKTTLFYHLNGIILPQKGKIIVKGREITKKNVYYVRTTVGLVFQDPDDQLFAPTVWDDLAFGPNNLGLSGDEVAARVEGVLSMLGIEEFRDRNPDNLSGGEKKKVAIAGVLAMNPEILVFDEPTSGLDPKSTSEMIELMDELASDGRTVIISTHNVDIASSWADYIYILRKGEIYAEGEPESVFSKDDLLKKTNLTAPVVVRTHREFEAHNIYKKQDKVPLTILDLVRNLNGSKKQENGMIWVVQIPGMNEGGAKVVDLNELRKILDLTPDRTGAMGTSAKKCVEKLGIACDFEHDVIDSAISEAMRGANVLIFASGRMADIVVERVGREEIKGEKVIPPMKRKV